MKRSITQIFQVLLILALMLTIPLFIEYISKTKYKKTPEITTSAAYTGGAVLGVTQNSEVKEKKENSGFRIAHTYTVYGITLLFLISLVSFINHKTKKTKHG